MSEEIDYKVQLEGMTPEKLAEIFKELWEADEQRRSKRRTRTLWLTKAQMEMFDKAMKESAEKSMRKWEDDKNKFGGVK